MNKIAMSGAAAGLLRGLLARAGSDRDRILLTVLRSTDWQSLTFIGERHQLHLRVPGPGAEAVVQGSSRRSKMQSSGFLAISWPTS
jgi:hypothetical protein